MLVDVVCREKRTLPTALSRGLSLVKPCVSSDDSGGINGSVGVNIQTIEAAQRWMDGYARV